MRLRLLMATGLCLPALALANIQLDSAVQCTGELSFNTELTTQDSIACTGSLSFVGSTLSSDKSLFIQATDNLSFQGVTVSATELYLQSGGVLNIDASTVFNARSISASASGSTGGSPATGMTGTVPEPATHLLMALGLATLGAGHWLRRQRRA